MSKNTNTDWTIQCAVSSCGWTKSMPNNEGALEVMVHGGYGDFIDCFSEEDAPQFTLCHKHAHRFANWLNNPAILHPAWGHSHNGGENGFWYGHIGWDQKTWLAHLRTFTWWLFKQRSFKKAWSELVESLRSHIKWTRADINDSSTPVVWPQFFFQLFFLDNAYRGTVAQWKRKYVSWKYQKAATIYRKYKSFYSELWEKVIQEDLTPSQKNLLIDIGKALEQQEEE